MGRPVTGDRRSGRRGQLHGRRAAAVAGGVRKGTLTRDLVIEKILRWNALYGEPPSTADWNPSLARWRAQEWRIERYRLGLFPLIVPLTLIRHHVRRVLLCDRLAECRAMPRLGPTPNSN